MSHTGTILQCGLASVRTAHSNEVQQITSTTPYVRASQGARKDALERAHLDNPTVTLNNYNELALQFASEYFQISQS
jgi:hypothetical protein